MPLRVSKSAYVTSLVVLAVSAIAFGAGIKAAGVYLQKLPIYPAGDRKTDKIPAETPTWISAGPDIREPPEIEEVLGTKNYVSRAYFKKIDPRHLHAQGANNMHWAPSLAEGDDFWVTGKVEKDSRPLIERGDLLCKSPGASRLRARQGFPYLPDIALSKALLDRTVQRGP